MTDGRGKPVGTKVGLGEPSKVILLIVEMF